MTPQILLIEDNAGDAQLMRIAFDEALPDARLSVIADGETALNTLLEGGPPDLVLLDLNLPKFDGRQVLAEIKADDDLRTIPVVVLTTSSAEEDILRSYQLHANAYVTKPVDFARFIQVVRQIDDFFVSVVRLPARNGH